MSEVSVIVLVRNKEGKVGRQSWEYTQKKKLLHLRDLKEHEKIA